MDDKLEASIRNKQDLQRNKTDFFLPAAYMVCMPAPAYEVITNRILELMKSGTCPWKQPWSSLHTEPRNFFSDRRYSGINQLLLSTLGYETPYFLTFNQAETLGGRIKKGSRGCPVVYWRTKSTPLTEEEKNNPKVVVLPRMEHRPLLRYYTVFNSTQIEGIDFPTPAKETQSRHQKLDKAEEIVKGWTNGPALKIGHAQACYVPSRDEVQMPSLDCFFTPESYYGVLFHEMGHATGAPTRLARKLDGRFGDSSYAKEELIAEMTSAFLCANCGIDSHVIDNQAAYLKNWIEVLSNDPRMVLTASGAAHKSANLIQGMDTVQRDKIQAIELAPSTDALNPVPHAQPARQTREAQIEI